MALSKTSVNEVGNRWTDDSRSKVKVFLTAVPVDYFLFLVDKREELGLIVRVESPIREVLGYEPWEFY